MDIINVVCEKISNNIANELELDNEKKSVVNYGIFAFIQMSISIIFVFIFIFCFPIFFFFAIIRIYFWQGG